MIIQAEAAFASGARSAASTSTPLATTDRVGFLTVPDTEDAAVLLLLDLGTSHTSLLTDTAAASVQAWQCLHRAGYPCLLAVPATPVKPPPTPPSCLVVPQEGNTSEVGSTGGGSVPRSQPECEGFVGLTLSEEEPLYVCLRGAENSTAAANTGESDPPSACASPCASNERWYQLWLPNPALTHDLHQLLCISASLPPLEDAAETARQRVTYGSSECESVEAATARTPCAGDARVCVVCRDVWTLPPISASIPPSPLPLPHAASSPICGSASPQRLSTAPPRPASTVHLTTKLTALGDSEPSLDSSMTADSVTAQPLWTIVAQHVRRLQRWHASSLGYLFTNSNNISDGLSPAVQQEAIPSALQLLQVLFRYWHQLLRAPRVSDTATTPASSTQHKNSIATREESTTLITTSTINTPSVSASPVDASTLNTYSSVPTTAAATAATTAEMTTHSQAKEDAGLDQGTATQTSPLLSTPTQISRAFFQETLRKQLSDAQKLQQQQQQLQQQQQQLSRSGAVPQSEGDSAVGSWPPQPPLLPSIVVSSELPPAEAALTSASASPSVSSSNNNNNNNSGNNSNAVSVSAASAHHLTSVALVEQLLLSMDFAFAYQQSVDAEEHCANATNRSAALPLLSPTVSFAEVWGMFLTRRLLRNLDSGDTDRYNNSNKSTFNNVYDRSKKRGKDQPVFDLHCDGVDVWRTWVQSADPSAELSASDENVSAAPTASTALSLPRATRAERPAAALTLVTPTPLSPIAVTPVNIESSSNTDSSKEVAIDGTPSLPATAAVTATHEQQQQQQQQSQRQAQAPAPKRATSHVSFSVSDVQRPYAVHAAPDVVAAEAAERAAARHKRERPATPPTPPMDAHVKQWKADGDSSAKKVGHRTPLRTVPSVSSTSNSVPPPPAAAAAAAAATRTSPTTSSAAVALVTAQLLQVVLNPRCTAVHRDGTVKAVVQRSAEVAHTPVVPSPRPCSDRTRATTDSPSSLVSSAHMRSELPSVAHTALPLHSPSYNGSEWATYPHASSPSKPPPQNAAGVPATSHQQPSTLGGADAAAASATASAERPPSRIESWASSVSDEQTASAGAEEKTSVAHTMMPVMPQQQQPTALSSNTLAATTNASSSSSLSMIASEHRLLPLIDDDESEDNTDEGGVKNHQSTVAFAAAAATLDDEAAQEIRGSEERQTQSAYGRQGREEAHTENADSAPHMRRRRGGVYSAANFTTVLADLVSQVITHNSSTTPRVPVPPSSSMSAPAQLDDWKLAQQHLQAIHRGQLFPSLAQLDTLNLLPYYVHVWCYTYDPLTQKRRRRGGGGGGGGTSVIDAGGSGTAAAAAKAVSLVGAGKRNDPSPYSRYASSYLQRYEAGSGGSYRVGGYNGGDAFSNFSTGGAAGGGGVGGASTQQLLRGLMRDGARALWQGVKSTTQRKVRDALGYADDAAAGSSDNNNTTGASADVYGLGRRHGLAASSTTAAAAASAASVYGGGGASGRDVTTDPSLYYAVCGLYITEQDVVIRSMPTAEVRKRREKARERRMQQQQQQQQWNRRSHSLTDVRERERVSSRHGQHTKPRYCTGACEGDDELDEDETYTEGGEVEETELLLLPRVGLLSVTACTVDRNAGGVFADKYAHKLFLHQEEQVVALRTQQQQQKRQYRSGLQSSASVVGLADSAVASPRSHVSRKSDGSSAAGVDLMGSAGATAAVKTIRTHTTLVPYVEEMIHQQQQQQQQQQANAMKQAHSASASPHHSPDHTPNSTSTSAAAAQSEQRRSGGGGGGGGGVQRYVTSFFQSTPHSALASPNARQAEQTLQEESARLSATAGDGGSYVSPFSQPATTRAVTAASRCSATAVALAAAAAVLSAAAASPSSSSSSSSQLTLVLKLESKAMPTVWLEFADATTLTYVQQVLEAPLRSASVRAVGMGGDDDGTSKTDPIVNSTHFPPSASSLPDAAAAAASAANMHVDVGASRIASCHADGLLPRLSCFGNRFLSSARRPQPMVALVLVAAGVLPRGSAASAFMQAFLKNVSVAMTVARLTPTATSAIHTTTPERRTTSAAAESERFSASSSLAAVVSLADTWWLYDPVREFQRQGMSPDKWSLTCVNDNFAFSPTYPSRFVVPTAVAESLDHGELSGQHRVSRRVEAVAFYYAPTGGVLVRSAQPAIARLFVNSATPALEMATLMTGARRSAAAATATANAAATASGGLAGGTWAEDRGGEKLRSPLPQASTSSPAPPQHQPSSQLPPPPHPPQQLPVIPLMDVPFLILNAFAAAAGVSTQQLVVMDLRAVTAAYANMVRGGGTMDMLLYPFGLVEYAGLPNIHEIRKAWTRLRLSLIDVPYRLTSDGAARRETPFVLRGGEPPYAAVVAAAERCAVSARPATLLGPQSLPSSQHQRHRQTQQQQQQQQQQTSSMGSGKATWCSDTFNEAPPSPSAESDVEESTHRARCLDVVQQAATAARSNTVGDGGDDRYHHNLDGAPFSDGEGEGDDSVDGMGGNTNPLHPSSSSAASATPLTAAPTSSFFSFTRSSGTRGDDAGHATRASSTSAAATAASVLSTGGGTAAAAAAAAETTSPAQQEWLGYLCSLLNTSVVAARRVCGVPTDPLYVPAMEHNGTTPNCFSYVVGHAFTRFWLPSGQPNTSAKWFSTRGADHARTHSNKRCNISRFDTSPASFEFSADRSLAQVVFLNCSDGWDRTAQISILTQLLLEPYYRTVEGFCVLLERELVCFGHPLQKRSTCVRGNVNGGWDTDRNGEDRSSSAAAEKVSLDDNAGAKKDRQSENGKTRLTKSAPQVQQQQQQRTPSAAAAAGQSLSSSPENVCAEGGEGANLNSNLSHNDHPISIDSSAEDEGDDEDDLEEWLREDGDLQLSADLANASTDEQEATVMGDTEDARYNTHNPSSPSSSSPQHPQRSSTAEEQAWNKFWRRAASAVSGGTSALRDKVISGATSLHTYRTRHTQGSSASGGKGGVSFPSSSSSAGLRDAAPIVSQLMDAVYQLVRLYPACFEFTEQFVEMVVDLHHCGLVSTFSVNAEEQVEREAVPLGTLSLSQWCALLLSTTTTTPSTATISATSTHARGSRVFRAKAESDAEASTSSSLTALSLPRSAGPTQLPAQSQSQPPPQVALSGGTALPLSAGGDATPHHYLQPEMSVTTTTATTFSSVEASFQRLDSQFLMMTMSGYEEEHAAGEQVETDPAATAQQQQQQPQPQFLISSTPLSGANGSERTEDFATLQHTRILPSGGVHVREAEKSASALPTPTRAAMSTSMLSECAVFTFDHPTCWNSTTDEERMHGRRGRTASGTSSRNEGANGVHGARDDEATSAFRQRLLPISVDALYTSGYLNPEFSLRFNKLHVGPLVDFILPSQLVLWRSVYARHSFWSARQSQLQHGAGSVGFYGAAGSTDETQSASHVQYGGGGGDVRSNTHFAREVATAHASPFSHAHPFGVAHAGVTTTTAATPGIDPTTRSGGFPPSLSERHGESKRSSRGSLAAGRSKAGGMGATPPSYVSPPGMMNFHIGSESDEESAEERWR